MPRILTKGSQTGVEDEHVGWSEKENLKHFNIAFYDLLQLQHQKHELVHPWFDFDEAVHFPSRDDVVQYLFGGNDLVVRLPENQEIELRGENRDGETERYSCDLFEWLPFYVSLNDEEDGSDLVEVDEGFEDWRACFEGEFEWEVVIQDIGQRSWYRSDPYSDPRPRPSKPGMSQQLPETRAAPSTADYGPNVECEVMAVENVGRTIAAEITLLAEEDGDIVNSDGSVFLVPANSSKRFDEFTQDILTDVFEVDVEQMPEWVSDYPVPGEEDIQSELEEIESRVADLEEELERAEWFRQLLFANDDEDNDYRLEEPVREAFREVGLTVEGEKSGKRDGSILLEEQTIILEVTGRKRGVKSGKIDKLERHVEDAEQEGYGENLFGLLAYNPFRDQDPGSRTLNPNNFKEDLEERGLKFITTYQVYQMLCAYERGDLSAEDIADRLTGEDTIIEFDISVDKGEDTIQDQIDSVRKRLSKLFQ